METRIRPTKPQFDILQSDSQVNLFLAGQGSGKTFCAGVISGILITKYPGAHGFIAANTYMQLSDSTLYRIRNVWKDDFKWTEFNKSNPKGDFVVDVKPPPHFNTTGHEYDTYYGKICFRNGTVIYKGSLDNYKAHEGKEFAWAILDETKDTKEEAVKEVIIGRLREKGMTTPDGKPWNPLYIFTSPAKVQWINEWFSLDEYSTEITTSIYSPDTYFKKKVDNKFAVISSTYHNIANLPENYIDNQKKNMHRALQDMLIYGNPFSQSGGEFYKCFSRTYQVDKLKYDPALPLHISFDFNVNPYMTCTIWQFENYEKDSPIYKYLVEKFLKPRGIDLLGKPLKVARQIDELCMSNPNNTTPAISKEFARKYHTHAGGLYVYGDPAGDHEDTRVEKRDEKKYNDFRLIMTTLAHFKPALRVEKAAPPVVMRGNFINTCFEQCFAGVLILIDEKCKNTINDYQYLKEASDGRKAKEVIKDEQTKVSYQKHGHTSDANDYILCRIFMNEFITYQRGTGSANISTSKSIARHGY